MKRLLLDKLLEWKKQASRKPILLDGARQTGKSYLLEVLFGQYFDDVVRIDFLEQPSLVSIFEDSLKPQDILFKIELEKNKSIEKDKTLIIFDEIGECQGAVNSLKYFAEQCPNMFVCASGSNIGLLDSFPVGKVDMLNLYPLSFEEFVLASGQKPLTEAFYQMNMSKVAHKQLFSLLSIF